MAVFANNEVYKLFEESEGLEKALYAIAVSLDRVAYRLRELGNGDAATPMGAIEALGKVLEEGFERMASAMPD